MADEGQKTIVGGVGRFLTYEEKLAACQKVSAHRRDEINRYKKLVQEKNEEIKELKRLLNKHRTLE